MERSSEWYDNTKQEMESFLNAEISRYVSIVGSREKLSLLLGHLEDYVQKIIQRQAFSALERLWRECKEINGNKKPAGK